MSENALDFSADHAETIEAADTTAQQRDWVEFAVHTTSRLAGYASLAGAVAGIAYLVIR